MNIIDSFDQQKIIDLTSGFWLENAIGEHVVVFSREKLLEQYFPDLMILSAGSDEAFVQSIRESLYALYFDARKINIGDIGHYTGEKEQLPVVLSRLISYGIVPLLICPDQAYTHYLYLAYCELKQRINLISVDDYPNLQAVEEELTDENWLTYCLAHTPNFLFNYSLMAYQGYLTNPSILGSLHTMNFDCIRLGQIRKAIEFTEPYFRNADLLSFDLSSIRFADSPGNLRKEPNGLYAEEACRLLRYAGMSNKTSSVHIAGWGKDSESANLQKVSSNLVAQLIWHFIDGFYSRIEEGPIGDDSAYTTYKLTHSSVGKDLIFFKSNRSGRWWMNVPSGDQKDDKSLKNMIVPCNYEDYQQALEGEIPETWWLTFQKL